MKLKKNLIKYGSKRNPPTMNDLVKNMEKPSNMTTKQFNDLKKKLKENPQLGFNALQMVLQYSKNQYGGAAWSSYLPSFNYFTAPKNEEQDNINNNVQNEKTRMNIASSVKEKGRKTRRTMVPSKIQNKYRKNVLKRSTKNNVHYWENYPKHINPKPLFANNPEYGSHAPLGITYQQPQPINPINPPSLQGSLLLGALLLGAYEKYYRTPNKKSKKPPSPKSASKKPPSPKSASKKPPSPKSISKSPSKKPLTPKPSYRHVSFPKIKTKTKTLKKL